MAAAAARVAEARRALHEAENDLDHAARAALGRGVSWRALARSAATDYRSARSRWQDQQTDP